MVGKLLILKFIIMKKKIIIASASVLFAVASVLNMNLLQETYSSDTSLNAIVVMAQANASEHDPNVFDGYKFDNKKLCCASSAYYDQCRGPKCR